MKLLKAGCARLIDISMSRWLSRQGSVAKFVDISLNQFVLKSLHTNKA